MLIDGNLTKKVFFEAYYEKLEKLQGSVRFLRKGLEAIQKRQDLEEKGLSSAFKSRIENSQEKLIHIRKTLKKLNERDFELEKAFSFLTQMSDLAQKVFEKGVSKKDFFRLSLAFETLKKEFLNSLRLEFFEDEEIFTKFLELSNLENSSAAEDSLKLILNVFKGLNFRKLKIRKELEHLDRQVIDLESLKENISSVS